MGNRQSAPPCGAPVTARPATPDLTERDARSLHELYAHDAELLRLMTEAEALRDLAKRARDACATHFHHALVATKHEQVFGVSLVAMSRRMHALGAPVDPGETPERISTSRPGASLGGAETRDRTVDEPHEPSEKAAFSNDVDGLARKLGDAHVATAVSRGRVYARLLANIDALARDVERAHRVSLESAAKAHEKAYNQTRAPRKRLERLRRAARGGGCGGGGGGDARTDDDDDERLPTISDDTRARDDDDVALRIDRAEVDLGKRVGIMKETTIMLRARSAAFLADWTPRVANAFRGLNFAQRDALRGNAAAFGEECLGRNDCGGSTEAARRACRAYLSLDACSIESDAEEDASSEFEETASEGRAAPRATPVSSFSDIAATSHAEGKAETAKAPAA